MEPVEVLEVLMDDNGYVFAIRGSQNLFDKMGDDDFKGVPRIVREPIMVQLMPPEIEDDDE